MKTSMHQMLRLNNRLLNQVIPSKLACLAIKPIVLFKSSDACFKNNEKIVENDLLIQVAPSNLVFLISLQHGCTIEKTITGLCI